MSILAEIEGELSFNNHISFVELGHIEGFKGDRELFFEGRNLVIWSGISAEAVEAIGQILKTGKAHIRPCSMLVYVADGAIPNLPLASKNRAYKEPHWLPCVLVRGRDICERKSRTAGRGGGSG